VHHNIAYNNDQRGFWFDGGGIGQIHPYKNIKLYCNASYENGNGINITAWAGMNIDSLIICNNIIFHNTHEGISTNFEEPTGQYSLRNIEILNNTIYENGTSNNGWADGGINITGNIPQKLLIRNNILSENAAYTICVQPDVPADSVTIDYNFFDGFRNFLHETAGTNTVFGNPLFVDSLNNDYHLQLASPAIDKGDPEQQYNDPEDPDEPGYALYPALGTVRNDMGAYGGPYASSWDLSSSVAPPSVPTMISPSNGATDVPTTLLLSWDGPWGATSYQVQVSTNSGFSSLVVDSIDVTGQSFGIRDLAGNTIYYWRVKASNAGGTSIYSNTWSFTIKDVSSIEEPGSEIPVACALYQNYPNPFTNSTEIWFALPERNKVNIDVFDVAGKKIETLINEILPPGYHKIVFDGSNHKDGIYLCRIRSGKYKQVMKMVLAGKE
jgi:hypothetical protein